MVHQAQAPEVGVARALGDLVAPPEVVFRFVEPLPVRTRHAEVVVGDRAPVLVVRLAVGLERAPVARQRFVEVALDVREDPQVLLGPGRTWGSSRTSRATSTKRWRATGARSRPSASRTTSTGARSPTTTSAWRVRTGSGSTKRSATSGRVTRSPSARAMRTSEACAS